MINILSILLILLFIYICFRIISHNNILSFIKDNKKYAIILFIILFTGFSIRLLLLDKYPLGFNQDEASSGYEAYSILNYGIDRNGYSFPVHFISWGSGQNVLYSYLSIIFIKLFGLNIFTTRIVMAIISSISIIFILSLFNRMYDDKRKTLIATFLFIIMPWHIMKSRWGLESNIFPDLLLWGTVLLYLGINDKSNRKLILSSVIFGISIYSYGTSYLFIPIYLLLIYLYLYKKKLISIKKSILLYLLVGIIAFPMIIFVIINYFNLNSINLLFMSIPKLYVNRFTTITSVNGNLITNFIMNLCKSFLLFFTQNDVTVTNCIDTGILYYISIIFILYGIYKSIYDKELFININKIWLITSIIVCGFIDPNINRINFIWIPFIIFMIYGILLLIKNKKILKIILGIYLISFIAFVIIYFTIYQDRVGQNTFYGYMDALEYVQDKNYDNLYIDNEINESYIYYLFVNKISPYDYLENRKVENYNVMFQKVNSISNVYFNQIYNINKNDIYIVTIKNYDIKNMPNYCTYKTYGYYYVIDCTN